MPLGLGHTLTNPFLEKFYQKFKKLLKLFQFPIKIFPKMVYYYVPLGHTLVKSIYIYIYIDFINAAQGPTINIAF